MLFFSDTGGNPAEDDVMKGVGAFKENHCDSVISMGGGCPLDVAKGILLIATHGG